MQTTLINTPKLFVHMKTGSEGSSHDPYSYEELYMQANGHKITMHYGLAYWCEIDDEKIIPVGDAYCDPHHFDKQIKKLIGYTPEQLRRFSRKAKESKANEECPKGGFHSFEEMSGYPGEHFTMCSKCNQSIDYYFCESAII